MSAINRFINKVKYIPIDIKLLAVINFSILSFACFIGTDNPFQERLFDAYEAETSNINNQITYLFLFISSLLVSSKIYNRILGIVKKEKFLTILIFISFISFTWSDYSFLSIKRSFQLFVTFLVLLDSVILINRQKLMFILIIVSFLYILLNYFAGLFIPHAIDPAFGTWRGIELQKNILGYSSLMTFIIGIAAFSESDKTFTKLLGIVVLILSMVLIILSYSTTNIIGMITITFILTLISFKSIFKPIGMGKFIFNALLFFILITGILLSIYSKELLSVLPSLFGKDSSFTGRDLIWAYIWNEILKRPILGYGYGTYWIMGTHIIDLFTAYVGWRVNESHNGFLEIFLQLGIVGFIFFTLTLITFIKNTFKLDDYIALIIIVAILLVNFSESFIFTARDPSTLIFILYYALLIKKHNDI